MTAVITGAASGPALADRWGPPFRLAGPMPLDLTPANLAFAPAGTAAVGFGEQDEDSPANSQAFSVVRSARGRTGRLQPVAGAQQILALGYDGTTLKLLTAASPSGHTCCSATQLVSVPAAGQPSQRTVTEKIAGPTMGQLLILPRHVTVAAVAAGNGVWVERAPVRGGHRPGPARRLTAASAVPSALASAVLSGGRSVVAWTASPGSGAPPPREIAVALGSATSAPRSPRTAVRVPAGHGIDELQVTGGSAQGTAAYVESWFDRTGAFHSQVAAADLKPPARPKAFPVAGRAAAGVSLASNGRGDQVLAWKACDSLGLCRVETAARPAGGRFGPVSALGSLDASEDPVAAVAPDGEAIVGWVANGHVFAAEQPRLGARFAPVHRISATNYAADLTFGFAPNGNGLAVWTQGTLNSSVMAATLR